MDRPIQPDLHMRTSDLSCFGMLDRCCMPTLAKNKEEEAIRDPLGLKGCKTCSNVFVYEAYTALQRASCCVGGVQRGSTSLSRTSSKPRSSRRCARGEARRGDRGRLAIPAPRRARPAETKSWRGQKRPCPSKDKAHLCEIYEHDLGDWQSRRRCFSPRHRLCIREQTKSC